MPGYRLYFLNNDGHIVHAAESECADDAEAEAWAKDQADGRYMELWSGARRVAEFPVEPRR